ncbi:Rap1a/Tai family immunity protein [Shinella kummerowiae]
MLKSTPSVFKPQISIATTVAKNSVGSRGLSWPCLHLAQKDIRFVAKFLIVRHYRSRFNISSKTREICQGKKEFKTYMRFFPVFSGAILSVHLAMGVAWAVPGDKTRDWKFSGFELIEALEGRSSDEMSGEADPSRPKARAVAYIAGVADATRGTRWCGAGTVLPHELIDRVYTYLQSLASARLKRSASSLVVEGLAGAFPCRAN